MKFHIIWLFLVFVLLYVAGFTHGKRSRKIDLGDCSVDVRRAFAGFLQHEMDRHDRDKKAMAEDLRKLMYQGVTPPKNFPIGYWWRV